MRSRPLKTFAKILPIILIVTSISALFIGGFIFGRWDYSVRGVMVAVPSIIASFFLIYMYRAPLMNIEDNRIILLNVMTSSNFIFIIIYLLSIIVLLLGINRLIYLLIISALYLIIFFQIFSHKSCTNLIIFEIIFVMANIIYGTTFGYPFFFRTGDILRHVHYSTVILLSGHIIPVDLDPTYATFPLFHIYNAISSALIGLPSKETHFIIMCPIYIILIIFLYKIFKKISNNEQISLLACLCFSVNPVVLTRGIEMITSVTAFVGFVILLYLLFTFKAADSIIYKALIILVTLFIILVHQVSILQILLLIGIFMICELILDEKRYFPSSLILFIILPFVSYWIYTSRLFIDWLILTRLNLDYLDFGKKISTTELDQMQIAEIFLKNNIYTGIFIFFALIGIGYILYRQKPQYLSVISLFSLLTLILYIPNPLFTSQTLSVMYRIDRFWILLVPFMSLAMASGIYFLIHFTQSRKKISYGIITIIFIVFVIFSLNNPILEITSNEERQYFTQGELNGFNYVYEKIPYGSEFYSDHPISKYFFTDLFSLTKELNLPYYERNILTSMEWNPKINQYIIFPDSKFKEGTLIFIMPDGSSLISYNSNEMHVRDVNFFYESNNILFDNKYISVIKGD